MRIALIYLCVIFNKSAKRGTLYGCDRNAISVHQNAIPIK